MKSYLHDHPGADPKNHSVAKGSGGGGSSSPTVKSPRMTALSKSLDEAAKKLGKPMKEAEFAAHVKDMSSMAAKMETEVEKILNNSTISDKDADHLQETMAGLSVAIEKAHNAVDSSTPRRHVPVKTDKAEKAAERVQDAVAAALKALAKHQ